MQVTTNWLQQFTHHTPLIIAGPCSAETEEQVLKIAHELKETKVSIYRAGIWKPRTRPGGFEGVGAIGLKWLNKVQEQTNLLVATEVANATHVKLALEHNIDVLWIGARTAVNPFAVQEIADALAGTDKIVLLKNPVNPDLSLWMGGLERLQNAGIKKLGVIHRGFSTYEKTNYRNHPQWQIPLDFKSKFPNIPVINDPSHITGRRDRIQEVAQQALECQFDGLMIESHCNPDDAWSDAAQQVTPTRLLEIIETLNVTAAHSTIPDFNKQLAFLRTKIDDVDASLIDAIGNRMQIASEIGELKKTQNVSIVQPSRWETILENMIAKGNEKGLSEHFIKNFFEAIHQESIEKQKKS